MKTGRLGPLEGVSRLVLGGGGLGGVWGATSAAEAGEVLTAAIDGGITLLDMAPGYRDAQTIIGAHFGGRLPDGVKVTTKEWIGTRPERDYAQRLRASLEASLKTMRLEAVDVFFLHNEIRPDAITYPPGDEPQEAVSTPLSHYLEDVVPAMEALVRDGLARSWGITATGHPEGIAAAMDHAQKPAVAQIVSNLLDSPGNLSKHGQPYDPRAQAAAAQARGIGVMGIRVAQAGALTAGFDREVPASNPNRHDFDRAAPFRALAAEWGADPADIALRYALGMDNIDCIVLGVKSLAELRAALRAEADGPLKPGEMARIDGLYGR